MQPFSTSGPGLPQMAFFSVSMQRPLMWASISRTRCSSIIFAATFLSAAHSFSTSPTIAFDLDQDVFALGCFCFRLFAGRRCFCFWLFAGCRRFCFRLFASCHLALINLLLAFTWTRFSMLLKSLVGKWQQWLKTQRKSSHTMKSLGPKRTRLGVAASLRLDIPNGEQITTQSWLSKPILNGLDHHHEHEKTGTCCVSHLGALHLIVSLANTGGNHRHVFCLSFAARADSCEFSSIYPRNLRQASDKSVAERMYRHSRDHHHWIRGLPHFPCKAFGFHFEGVAAPSWIGLIYASMKVALCWFLLSRGGGRLYCRWEEVPSGCQSR